MLKDVVSALDYSSLAEVALVIFAVCFLAMTVATLLLKRSATDRFASIPLSDSVEDPRHD